LHAIKLSLDSHLCLKEHCLFLPTFAKENNDGGGGKSHFASTT
jgi:hypothetical protein